MLTFCETCFCASGSNRFVDYFGMTESFGFVCYVRIITNGASVSGVTCFGASGIGNNYVVRVTESVNRFLCNENFVANRAMLTFCETCFCASRSNSSVNNFGVTESINYCLSNKDLVTSRAMDAFCQTCFCASRSNSSVNNFGVTESRNNGLSYQNLVTARTLFAFCKTGCGTSGSDCFKNNCIPVIVIVRKFCDGGCFKYITRSAIAAFLAFLSFGGFFHDIPFSKTVSCLGDNILCYKHFVANGAMLTFGKTCCGAGRSDCFVNNFCMTCRIDTSPLLVFITSSTICILPSRNFTERRNRFFPITKCMAECRDVFYITTFATVCTGIENITFFLTGGVINTLYIVVPSCLNYVLRNKHLIASSTMLSFCKACFGAGRCNCIVNNFCMSVRKN